MFEAEQKKSYFFFQAEDGIRALTVTGVQTCALPISAFFNAQPESSLEECCKLMEENQVRRIPIADEEGRCCGIITQAQIEIGRASCRERGVKIGGRHIIKKDNSKKTRSIDTILQ